MICNTRIPLLAAIVAVVSTAGAAPYPGREPRPFQSEKQVIEAIHSHLTKASPANRSSLRYFTLTNLFNNYKQVTNDEMKLYRAALSKLINSLSLQPGIVVPQA